MPSHDRDCRPGNVLLVFVRDTVSSDRFHGGRFSYALADRMEEVPLAVDPRGRGPLSIGERSTEFELQLRASDDPNDIVTVVPNAYIFGRFSEGL